MRSGLVLVVVAVSSLLAGCPWSVPGVDGAAWPCASDGDCATALGYRCDERSLCTRKPLPDDAGELAPDGGDRDAGDLDGGAPNADGGGLPDGGLPDGGLLDGGLLDAGPDGGFPDAGPDGGFPDAGPLCPLGVDADGDGRGDGCAFGPDCDDADPRAWLRVALYLDEDGDGVPSSSPAERCVGGALPRSASLAPPEAGDCDDADPTRWQIARAWPDADDDGAALTTYVPLCVGDVLPPGFLAARPDRPDCDDADPRRAPGAVELCDGVDNDCDGVADEGASCPCPVVHLQDRLRPYLTCTTATSWHAARDACAASGYELAAAETQVEHGLLQGLAYGMGGAVWIGLNDVDAEGAFRWLDGSAPAYSGWLPNEPNQQGDEDCVELYLGGWNDFDCTQNRAYLCEAAPPPPPDDEPPDDEPTDGGPGNGGLDGGLDGGVDGDAGSVDDGGPEVCADDDGDGWYTGPCAPAPDCDDDDPDRFAWRVGYPDRDDDGSAGALPELVCTSGALPDGWQPTPPETPDCDDDDDEVLDTITAYPDEDRDGAPSANGTLVSCIEGGPPDGYTAAPPATPDCDDGDPARAPGLVEACDGRDEDCSGFADDGDGVCPCPVAYPPGEPLRPYLFCETQADWMTARSTCFLTGYDLVLIGDEGENAFVQQEIDARGDGSWWTGGTDMFREGTWSWLDGTVFWQGATLTYDDWGSPPATNDNDNDCLVVRKGDWNDVACDNTRKFICELPDAP